MKTIGAVFAVLTIIIIVLIFELAIANFDNDRNVSVGRIKFSSAQKTFFFWMVTGGVGLMLWMLVRFGVLPVR